MTEAAEHANSNVVLQEEFQRMLKLQARLGDWELIKPGTKGVLGRAEGDLVLQRTPPPLSLVVVGTPVDLWKD